VLGCLCTDCVKAVNWWCFCGYCYCCCFRIGSWDMHWPTLQNQPAVIFQSIRNKVKC